jgi:tetratricopeptide (TPR) repeat protein
VRVAIALALVISLAQAAPSQAAFGAARPAECGVSDGSRAGNVWERAKEPQLREYCALLARGTAHLVNSPALVKDVLTLSAQADKLLPGRAAPKVLEGRALLRLGKAKESLASLSEAKKRDERALDDPVALLAWARANARSGHADEAAEAYRAALPRTSALTASERSAASFEAGMIVMSQGPRGLDDAIAMLRQARRDAADTMQLASVVALALALDRAGQRDEARAVLAERVREGTRPLLTDAKITEALADAGVAHEVDALTATVLDLADPGASREAWRRYLDGAGAKGAWAEHARAREGASAGGAKKKEPPRERGAR